MFEKHLIMQIEKDDKEQRPSPLCYTKINKRKGPGFFFFSYTESRLVGELEHRRYQDVT